MCSFLNDAPLDCITRASGGKNKKIETKEKLSKSRGSVKRSTIVIAQLTATHAQVAQPAAFGVLARVDVTALCTVHNFRTSFGDD
jgi:hypothetical protein